MPLGLRRYSRRRVVLGNRDHEALNALHRGQIHVLNRNINWLISLLPAFRSYDVLRRIILESIVSQYTAFLRIVVVDIPDRGPRINYNPMTFEAMEGHLRGLGIDVSERYRFQSIDILRRFKTAFHFPVGIILLPHRYKSNAEEIILISLERLSFPHRWSDLYERFPGRKRWFLKSCFYWFLDFMVFSWGYLLLNNVNWWKPRLMGSCEAIRNKLATLNHIEWRQFFPAAARVQDDDGRWMIVGLQVALFIDCTMMAFSRPGGVMGEGPGADRHA
jgi:hypothetical protein